MVEVKVSEDDLERLVWVRTQSAGGQVGGQREEPHTSVNQQVAKQTNKKRDAGKHQGRNTYENENGYSYV